MMHNHLRYISSIAIFSASIFLNGCDNTFQNNETTIPENTLLTVNDKSLSHNDLPMADQLKLFNSEFQLHQLTLSSLRETIEKNHNPSDTLNWNVTNPIAPSINLNIEASWQKNINPHNSKNNNNITLDILCSYASRPCSDIISAIEEFSAHTDLNIQINFYDFWQNYHKNALSAAAAVYCSDEQAKTQLQKSLWLRQGNIDMPQLTSNIDVYNHESKKASSVYACMQSNDTISFLNNNHKALQALGFRQTPSILINGHYISRGQEVSQIFNSLYPHMKLAIEQGDRSVTWLQSWLATGPLNNHAAEQQHNKNWAILEHKGQILRLDKGSNITNMYLAQIKKDHVIVYKNGRLLSFGQPPSKALTQTTIETKSSRSEQDFTQADTPNEETDIDTEQEEERDHQAHYESIIANIEPQSLPQAWLEEQLMRQSELEESLFHTDGKIEGKSLVKLNKENIDEFYSSLGMMPGDVIMRVNDDWIHEESNTLFQSLANEEKVTISVMRKGLPVHLAFEVAQ